MDRKTLVYMKKGPTVIGRGGFVRATHKLAIFIALLNCKGFAAHREWIDRLLLRLKSLVSVSYTSIYLYIGISGPLIEKGNYVGNPSRG